MKSISSLVSAIFCQFELMIDKDQVLDDEKYDRKVNNDKFLDV